MLKIFKKLSKRLKKKRSKTQEKPLRSRKCTRKCVKKGLKDELDLIEILQTERNHDVDLALIKKISETEAAKLFSIQKTILILLDFVLTRHALTGGQKNYKDFRDDFRILLIRMEKSFKISE